MCRNQYQNEFECLGVNLASDYHNSRPAKVHSSNPEYLFSILCRILTEKARKLLTRTKKRKPYFQQRLSHRRSANNTHTNPSVMESSRALWDGPGTDIGKGGLYRAANTLNGIKSLPMPDKFIKAKDTFDCRVHLDSQPATKSGDNSLIALDKALKATWEALRADYINWIPVNL